MIKINLLGKKKEAAGGLPFGLDEKLAKAGLSGEDLAALRPGLIRLAVLLAGLYVGNFVPNYFHQKKIEELTAVLNGLERRQGELQRELASKRDVRKQMESLAKEEMELQRQLTAVNNLQKDRSLAFRTADHMVTSLPGKVWIQKFSFQDRRVNLNGSCWEYFPITDFVRSINESTQYSGVSFKDVKTEAPSGATLVRGVPAAAQKTKNFQLSFTVKSAGES